MQMISDDRGRDGGAKSDRFTSMPAFDLLGAAMASGLCLDLMIERLLDGAAGEPR